MLKRLSQCIREYRKDTLLSPLFVSLEVIMEVLIPYLMSKIIDNGIDRGDMDYILRLGGVLVACALLSLLFGAFSGHFAANASSGFARNVRHDLYYAVQDFGFENIDRFSTSGLVTRLTTDVTNLQNAFQMIVRICVRAPVMLVFSLFMAFRVNSRLAMVFLAAAPVLVAGLAAIIHFAFPNFQKMFDCYDRLNSVVQENVTAMRVVKAYVREPRETDKFCHASGEIFRYSKAAERILAFNAPLMQLCMYGCMLGLSWFGAKTIVSGEMLTGQLMTMFTYTMQILMSLMMISMIFVMLTMSRASAERVVEVLQEKSRIVNRPQPLSEVPDGSITFDHVDFSYSDDAEQKCLDNICLTIRQGETVGIIGGTGSAKSTLVQLIPRLYDVSGGSVKVGGHDVREYDLETLRGEVAMVLQKNVLFSGSVKENLRWGDADASDEALVNACRQAQADGFVREFPDGYDTMIDQGGTNVSGGQRQRLCIARALLKKPKILILDDSTSAVDTKTDAMIRRAFREELPDTTKLIIAQRISSVEHADKVIVMDNGRVSGFGTPAEMLETNHIYQEVYHSQVKGGEPDAR
ncbi:ABC transporter ATP-binding protein [Butyricicoccus sp. 1XD8-22]|nr:ABC transporter ATP-binding protein [Butyricicoccus sp. 1XD8-22]